MTVPDHLARDDEGEKRGVDRRRAVRLPPSAIPLLKSVRLVAGPEVKLINISRGGALIESEARLSPGSTICVRLVSGDSIYLLKGRVLRARAASLSGTELRYHIALAFDEEFAVVPMDEALQEELPAAGKPSTEQGKSGEDTQSAATTVEEPEVVTVTAKYLEPEKELKRIFNVNDW